MPYLRLLLLSTIFAFASVPAFADYLANPYVSLKLGFSKPSSKTYVGTPDYYRIKSDENLVTDLAFGYQMDAFRAELALGYSINGAKNLTGTETTITDNVQTTNTFSYNKAGNTRITTLMLNGYYHFTPPMMRMVPYVGVGLGAAHLRHKLNRTTMLSGSDTSFAYQGTLGVACEINKNLRGSMDYRYLATSNNHLELDGERFSGRYGNHSINFGLTFFM